MCGQFCDYVKTSVNIEGHWSMTIVDYENLAEPFRTIYDLHTFTRPLSELYISDTRMCTPLHGGGDFLSDTTPTIEGNRTILRN